MCLSNALAFSSDGLGLFSWFMTFNLFPNLFLGGVLTAVAELQVCLIPVQELCTSSPASFAELCLHERHL